MTERRRIGVAGCGAMGLPMAERLLAAGFDTWGFDVRPAAEFGAFAPRMIQDPADFAARCETVISVVRDVPQTEDLLFGAQAILKGNARPATLVLSSTLSPRAVVALAEKAGPNVTVIDAPMSGAPYRARQGTLTFMLGGDAERVRALMPAFEAMGGVIHHLGPTGAGAACKVANNLCAAAGVVAVRHALKGAAPYGIQAATLLEVMRTSSGSTWYGDNIERIDWAREGYEPGNTMGILEKDVMSFIDAVGSESAGSHAFEDAVVAAIRELEPLS